MMGGGMVGANGLGVPAMNAGFGGANGISVGAMGYNPARHAKVRGIGNQHPQGGVGGGVSMAGGVPMAGSAANVAAGGIGFNANGFGGGLGMGGAAFGAIPPNYQNAFGVGLRFQPMGGMGNA